MKNSLNAVIVLLLASLGTSASALTLDCLQPMHAESLVSLNVKKVDVFRANKEIYGDKCAPAVMLAGMRDVVVVKNAAMVAYSNSAGVSKASHYVSAPINESCELRVNYAIRGSKVPRYFTCKISSPCPNLVAGNQIQYPDNGYTGGASYKCEVGDNEQIGYATPTPDAPISATPVSATVQ